MKYIQSRFTYVLVGVITIIAISVACSDSIKTADPEPADVDVNDLVQSAEFQNMVKGVERINKPIISSLKAKDAEELKAFRKKIEKHFGPETKQLRPSSSLDDLVMAMGYENKQQYLKLSRSLQDKISKFRKKYPSFKSLDDKKEKVLDRAAGQLLRDPASKDDMPTVADCEQDYHNCLSEASTRYNSTTVICVASGAINIVTAVACQATNVMLYEIDKTNCDIAYDVCTS